MWAAGWDREGDPPGGPRANTMIDGFPRSLPCRRDRRYAATSRVRFLPCPTSKVTIADCTQAAGGMPVSTLTRMRALYKSLALKQK